jgi:hypothetical protein
MPFWSRRPEPAPPAPAPPPAVVAPPADGALACSFCGKSQREVKKLVAGPNVQICDECIGLCNDILVEDLKASTPPPPSREALLAALADAVSGQPAAVSAVGAALLRHAALRERDEPGWRAQRVLLVGPRGCGKTALLAAACAAIPGLTTYHADAGRVTETGYVGEDVETVVGGLLARGDDGIRGLLALDSLHHLVRRSVDGRTTRDVAGREAQRDLVRLLDGLELGPVRQGLSHPQSARDYVRAERVLVLAAATLDPVPGDDAALRRALVDQGLVDETLSRFDTIVRMTARPAVDLLPVVRAGFAALAAELVPLGATPALGAGGAEALAAHAAASPDGAFALLSVWARVRERAWLGGALPVLDRDGIAALLAT